jgi:predicted permease
MLHPNLLLLVGCLVAGMLLRQSDRAPPNAHAALNAVIVHVSLPAVTILSLHAFVFDARQAWPVLMPWLLFVLGAAVFRVLGGWLRLPRTSIGALTLVGGLGNTSFVGLPMIEWLHGREGLGLGLLIDQLGSYLVLATLGVFAASHYSSGERQSVAAIVRKVATFPPFIALVAALLLRPVAFPAEVDVVLARLGETLAPLALLSVGLQLRFDALRGQARSLGLGLGYKLVACPALMFALLWSLDVGSGMTSQVTMIEAAMPPMIGAAIVAGDAKLDAPLASSLIGIGIPLGLMTAALWHGLFQRLL